VSCPPEHIRDPAGQGPVSSPRGHSISAALAEAYGDTLTILFRPFDARRWLKLSILCLFLGGGTTSAAFNWSWGTLFNDVRFRIALDHLRRYISARLWLVALVSLGGVALVLGVLYLRSVLRFLLVDAILKRRKSLFSAAYAEVRPLGHSYFLWLTGSLTAGSGLVVLGAIGGVRYLRSAVVAGAGSMAFSIGLVIAFSTVVAGSLVVAVVITLTDDLVVPIMYAERLPLLSAWKKVARALRAEPGSFAFYVLVRFGVSLLIGVALLLLLFPVLLSLFSGFLLAGVLVVVAARVAGFVWVWNPVTILLASAALMLLTVLQLILLSIVGMPGQVFLQDYGMRFIAPRFPSPRLVWEPSNLAEESKVEG
jgi:hypothetical protein